MTSRFIADPENVAKVLARKEAEKTKRNATSPASSSPNSPPDWRRILNKAERASIALIPINGYVGDITRAIESVLTGNFTAISSVFSWAKTYQGHDYWCKRDLGLAPLNDTDKAYLRGFYFHITGVECPV